MIHRLVPPTHGIFTISSDRAGKQRAIWSPPKPLKYKSRVRKLPRKNLLSLLLVNEIAYNEVAPVVYGSKKLRSLCLKVFSNFLAIIGFQNVAYLRKVGVNVGRIPWIGYKTVYNTRPFTMLPFATNLTRSSLEYIAYQDYMVAFRTGELEDNLIDFCVAYGQANGDLYAALDIVHFDVCDYEMPHVVRKSYPLYEKDDFVERLKGCLRSLGLIPATSETTLASPK